jgi:hypothetical protein
MWRHLHPNPPRKREREKREPHGGSRRGGEINPPSSRTSEHSERRSGTHNHWPITFAKCWGSYLGNNIDRWLWVPAFARTTKRRATKSHPALIRQSCRPSCKGRGQSHDDDAAASHRLGYLAAVHCRPHHGRPEAMVADGRERGSQGYDDGAVRNHGRQSIIPRFLWPAARPRACVR